MYTGTIFHQPCVRNRPAHIDHTVDLADDLLNHVFQLLHPLKAMVPSLQPPAPLNENVILSIHHDFRNFRIIHQFLQNTQAAKAVKQPVFQFDPLPQRQILPSGLSHNGLVNTVVQLFISDLLKAGKCLPYLSAKLLQKTLCANTFPTHLSSLTKSPRSLHKSCSR